MTADGKAELQDYRALIADHPVKFTAAQVGFRAIGGALDGMPCRHCRHWFVNPATGISVCEIFRHADEHNVEPYGYCDFWTADGLTFPRLGGRL